MTPHSAANAHWDEPARRTPVVEDIDVLVAGGGPAGIATALAAAAAGAHVRLIESRGCLGGVWTAGLLTWILDKDNKPGLMQRLLSELDTTGSRQGNAYEPEAMKRLLERMCIAAGVGVRLHTSVVAAARDSRNRLAVVITESKSGREAWSARCFVDCTGDGDLAAHAGCGFDLGRETTGDTQPMTLMALLGGVTYRELNARRLCRGGDVSSHEAKKRLRQEMETAGITPSYADPTLFPIRDDLFGFMTNHIYGQSALDAQGLSDATLDARAELHAIVDTLRATCGVWASARLLATAEHIGVREGRRIRGRYIVTQSDLRDGRRHHDAVCRVTFPIDVHATNPEAAGTRGIERALFASQPYDIPFRSLIARDVDGLLMAGRCISGDFLAHSSYRVTGNAVAMGQAAGVAAALSSKTGRLPHELHWPALANAIDCVIDRISPSPLART